MKNITIQYILFLHQMRYVAGSRKVPSFTKKGPGRKHQQGKKKG